MFQLVDNVLMSILRSFDCLILYYYIVEYVNQIIFDVETISITPSLNTFKPKFQSVPYYAA